MLEGEPQREKDLLKEQGSEARVRELEQELLRLRDENACLKARPTSPFELLVRSVVGYAIFLLDPDGRVRSWNAGAEKLKGYTEAEILGRPLACFYPPDTPPERTAERLLALAAERGRVEDEGWRRRKDGSLFWAAVVITALRDEDGGLLGFAKVTRDLTERKRAEEEIRALNASLLEADAHKDQFLSVISHELRTPLNALLGFGSLLDDGALGPLLPEQLHAVQRMLSSADNLLALIDDLLDVSRMQAGRFSLAPEPMALAEVAKGALEPLAPLAARKGLTLVNRVPATLPALEADPQRIGQVLSNLLANAIKFTPEGGRIELRALREGEHLRCEVEDTGVGIASEDFPKLFQRFSQLDSSYTRRVGGAGLGLSIVKGLVEAHGGTLGVQSELNRGSVFWFTLPLPPARVASSCSR